MCLVLEVLVNHEGYNLLINVRHSGTVHALSCLRVTALLGSYCSGRKLRVSIVDLLFMNNPSNHLAMYNNWIYNVNVFTL